MTATAIYKKTVNIGKDEDNNTLTITIELREKAEGKIELSMTGQADNPRRRDAAYCGQIEDELQDQLDRHALKLTIPESRLYRMLEIWGRYHLNDMRPGCEHQRDWENRQIVVTTWSLNSATSSEQRKIKADWEKRLAAGETVTATEEEKHLANLPYFVTGAVEPPTQYYERYKEETKYTGHTYPKEHPEGFLCKPCPVCGYKYGSAWLYEPIPQDIIDEIKTW